MNPFAHLEESLSASRIGTYLRCPLRYFFNYIEKLPWEKISGAMLLGSAVDATAKEAVALVKQGWQKPEDLQLDELFDQFFKIEIESPRAPIGWGKRHDQDSMRDLGRSLTQALRPILFTEERLERIVDRDVAFTIPLLDEEGKPLIDTPLIGIFDFLLEIDGKKIPLELKTASNRTQYLPDNLSRDCQALIYAMAAQTLQRDGEAHVSYMSCVKLKKPEVIESDFKVDAGQLAWARGLVTNVKRAIDAELYHPAPSVMSCGGCPYTAACAKSGSVARSVPKRIFSRPQQARPAPR
ncbi:MAG: PD-(D/E)XK nuclease family protein [Deltaproteobacteria bacterium]|nr:PD-(D/E)XK nuclease family protein [Deltaproteobacteria bacterium]